MSRKHVPLFDVSDWLSEHVRVYRSGPTNLTASSCPICGKKGGKFYVRGDGSAKNGSYTAYCCSNIGNLTSLVSLVEGLSYSEAEDFIESRVDEEPTFIPITQFVAQAPPSVELPSISVAADSSAAMWVTDHLGSLGERGVTDYIIDRHKLLMTVYGTKYAGEDRKDLDFRLLVPVYRGGSLISWQARDMTGKARRKYLFPAGDRSSEWLYDFDAFIGETLLITEGVFHKWAWDRLGHELNDPVLKNCTVASFGKKLTEAQTNLLVQRTDIKNIVFAWDFDAAPEVSKVANMLNGRKNIYIMPAHPSGKDHDELPASELVGMWRTVMPFSHALEIQMKIALAASKMAMK